MSRDELCGDLECKHHPHRGRKPARWWVWLCRWVNGVAEGEGE